MKIVDEREMQKTTATTATKKRQKKQREIEAIVKGTVLSDFDVHLS